MPPVARRSLLGCAAALATRPVWAGTPTRRLFRLDAAGSPCPALVRDWAVSEDGLHWHFTLHDMAGASCVEALTTWAPNHVAGRALLASGARLAADGGNGFGITTARPFAAMRLALSQAPIPT